MKKCFSFCLCVLLLLCSACTENREELAAFHQEEDCCNYFYDMHTDEEKAAYDTMYHLLMSGEESADCKGITLEQAKIIHFDILKDHPEIYWTKDFWYEERKDGIHYSPDYLFTLDERTVIDEEIAARTQTLLQETEGMSEYEAALHLFERVVFYGTYDEQAAHNQSIYGAMIERRAVCAGIARMYQHLLLQKGIPALYVEGENKNGILHAWVEAKIEGEWSYFDPTYLAPTNEDGSTDTDAGRYAFFGMTDEDIRNFGYILKEGIPLPAASSSQNSYYSRNGALFSSYDRSQITEKMEAALQQGKTTLSLRFTSKEEAQRMVDDLFGNGGAIQQILQDFHETYPELVSGKTGYTHYPEVFCVDLYFE